MFTQEVVDIVFGLLPGFLTAWIFYGLTGFSTPSTVDRVIHALVLTAIVNTGTALLGTLLLFIGDHFSLGVWSDDIRNLWRTVNACTLGVVLAYVANRDWIHSFFRYLKLTTQTGYPSEWYSIFSNQSRWIVLHFKESDRRLMGFPTEWPDNPADGHFILESPSWLLTKGGESEERRVTGVKFIVVPASDIKMVELLSNTDEFDESSEVSNDGRTPNRAEQTEGQAPTSPATSTATGEIA